jgi:MFS family permease
MNARIFSDAGFRRLFAGMATSMFGDSVMLLVLSMWVKDLTGSNGRAGLTFLWMVLPSLAAPLIGLYLDRVRRKPLLVWGSVASAVAVLPLLAVHDAGDVWIVYAVAFLYGISFVALPAALNGMLKELVADDLLIDANAALQTTKEGYRLIGPLLGAGLYAWLGGGAVAVLDALSFAVAAVLIGAIVLREELPERAKQRWWPEVSAGARHLVREPVLRHVVVAFALVLFVLGYLEASIYALLDFYDKPATYAGVLVTVQGVGAILGGLTASRWARRFGEAGVVAVGLAVLGTSVGLVAATSTLAVVMVGFAVCGYSLPLMMVGFSTVLQRRTPQRLMGRVSAASDTLLGTPQAISLAVGAGLVTVLDFHVIWAIIAGVCALSVGYLAVALRGRLWKPLAPVESVPAG